MATVPLGEFVLLAVLVGVLLVGAFMAVPYGRSAAPVHRGGHKVIQAVPVDHTPSAAVLTAMTASLKTIDPGYTYAPALSYAIPANPALSGCSTRQLNWIPAPSISTSATLTSATATVMFRIDAYPAGLGQRVVDRTAQLIGNCGSGYVTSSPAPPLNGFTASATGSNEAIFRQGDVVVTLISFGGSPTDVLGLASSVSNTLASQVQPVCANINAPASDATLNPSQADYVAPTKTETVSPEPGQGTPPAMSLLQKAPPTVATPPTGSVTSGPVEPTTPTIATSATVEIPVADPTGPGCGWAFSGQAVPTPPSASTISSIKQAALNSLVAKWSAWPATVSAYLQQLGTYNANEASYQAYVKQQALAKPGAPVDVTVTPGDGSLSVTWNPPGVTSSPITSYTVKALDVSGTVAGTCTAGGGGCTVTGLKNGTTYTVVVVATNANGTGPTSNQVTGTPEAPTPPPTTTTTTTVPPTTTTTTTVPKR